MSRKSASNFVEVYAFEKEKGGFWIGLFLGNLQILLKRVFCATTRVTQCTVVIFKINSILSPVYNGLVWFSRKFFTKVGQNPAKLSKCQNHKEDGANSCGLLRKAEL